MSEVALRATRVGGQPGLAGRFAVPSATTPGRTYYVVWAGPGMADCACPSFTYRSACKHLKVVEELLEAERTRMLERRAWARARLAAIAKEFDCE